MCEYMYLPFTQNVYSIEYWYKKYLVQFNSISDTSLKWLLMTEFYNQPILIDCKYMYIVNSIYLYPCAVLQSCFFSGKCWYIMPLLSNMELLYY